MSLRLASLSDQLLPVEVNSLTVGPDGCLQHADPCRRPITFGFDYMGARFAAIARSGENGVRLHLSSTVMPVPFSAESVAARRHVLAIVDAARALAHGRLALSADYHVVVQSETALEGRLTPTNLIASTVRLLLELKPILAFLIEASPAQPLRRSC